jgi:hypothetical protein
MWMGVAAVIEEQICYWALEFDALRQIEADASAGVVDDVWRGR